MTWTAPSPLSPSYLRRLNGVAAFFFCISASFLALWQLDYPLIGIDDANIYFVYARNLANGHGFVYNVGSERVEGFTSLLWTLISALAFKLSAHPELILLMVNITLVSLGIACALGYLQHTFSGEDKTWRTQLCWSALFLLLVFTSPRYLVWNTITLMENALWSTLLLLTTIFVIQDHPSPRTMNFGFIPLSILLLLTRPESIAWVAVFAAILFLRLAFQSNAIDALKSLTPSIISIFITLTLLTLFRLYYFGYPLPNTYYAKVSPLFIYNLKQGLIYFSKYFVSDLVVTLCVVAIFLGALQTIWIVFSKRVPCQAPLFLPLIAGMGLLEPVLVGGDHFGSFRVYQNIYPIEVLSLLSLLSRGLREYTEPTKHPRVTRSMNKYFNLGLILVLALSIFQNQYYLWHSIESEIGIEFKVAEYGRKNGSFIQKMFAPAGKLPSLGVVTSGAIKYSYDGEVIDLMGLNNTTVAHNQGNRVGTKDHAAFEVNTFYQLQPDLVWPLTVENDQWQYNQTKIKESWENTDGLKGLFDEPRFRGLYTYAKVSGRSEKDYVLTAWFKKSFLKSIKTNDNFVVEEYEYIP